MKRVRLHLTAEGLLGGAPEKAFIEPPSTQPQRTGARERKVFRVFSPALAAGASVAVLAAFAVQNRSPRLTVVLP